MKNLKANQRVQIKRANGEIQKGTLIECITKFKDITKQWRVKVDNSNYEDVWSEKRMVMI